MTATIHHRDDLDAVRCMPTGRARRTWRFASLVVVAVVAAACGEGGGQAAGDTSESQDASGAGAETRTVEDALGEVELPVEFERPVPTDGIWAANMFSLGIQPAAVPSDVKLQLSTFQEHLPPDAQLADLPEIGIQYEINIEALAAARPDLIIASEFEAEDLAQQYRDIAPTYFVAHDGNGNWRERFRRVAEALGREDRVSEVEADYDALVDSLPDALRQQTVAFVRTSDPSGFRADILERSFAGSVAIGAGIPVLDVSDQVDIAPDASFVEASGEQLGILTGADDRPRAPPWRS